VSAYLKRYKMKISGWDRRNIDRKNLPFKDLRREFIKLERMRINNRGKLSALPMIGIQLIHLGILLIKLSNEKMN